MKIITKKSLVVALLIISAVGLIVYKIVDTKIKIEHTETISDKTSISTIQTDTILAQTSLYTMQIDTTFNLYVFKPNFSEVKLEIGKMPSTNNDSIIFCAAAAYTSSRRDTFAIDNIVGGYISNGRPHNICFKRAHYGRFVCINNQWEFIEIDNFSAIENTIVEDGSMFTQQWVIKSGDIYRPYARRDSTDNRFIYRALCEKNDTLMIAQSNHHIPYYLFVKALKAYGMENALYMDMGSGWNHSFYRDNANELHIIFPRRNHYCTNWITFYK